MRCAVVLVLGFLVACGLGGSQNRRGGWSEERIAKMPPELQTSYEVFAMRCSRCHTLGRPLGAGITDPEHWRRYVRRMRRMPGAGITVEDAGMILSFLEAHARWTEASKSGRGALPTWWDGPSEEDIR